MGKNRAFCFTFCVYNMQGTQKPNTKKSNNPIKMWIMELSNQFSEVQRLRIIFLSIHHSKCSEVQIKTALRFHLSQSEWLKLKVRSYSHDCSNMTFTRTTIDMLTWTGKHVLGINSTQRVTGT